ncbi:hypothetical protein BpHYR1_049255 [Brachionus plicatilis]|uniref:Uncharacterized protein n=1 Tax=Brachionus plicatilis TaxID=10195 RepID=A0A3M7RKE6_BRAPC|nr:hypothetical protein BpHYR1_049255 [Brachionus plicatilis]
MNLWSIFLASLEKKPIKKPKPMDTITPKLKTFSSQFNTIMIIDNLLIDLYVGRTYCRNNLNHLNGVPDLLIYILYFVSESIGNAFLNKKNSIDQKISKKSENVKILKKSKNFVFRKVMINQRRIHGFLTPLTVNPELL